MSERSISRRELYAAGEPLGECVTRAKPGGGYVCGGGGGGGNTSSKSDTSNTTNNTDRRQVVDGGSVGVSGDGNNVTVQAIDAGAVKAGADIALSAIATNATNTDHLLAAASTLFKQQQDALAANVDLAKTLTTTATAAYADAASQAQGNKNLVYAGLAVVALAGIAFIGKK